MSSRRDGQVIRRGDKKWLVRLYLGTDSNGKRHYFNRTVVGTKKVAEDWLLAAKIRHQSGEPLELSNDLFADYFAEWLKARSHQLRAGTIQDYQSLYDRHVKPVLGKKRLIDLDRETMQAFYNKLTERGLSAATVRLIHAVTSKCLRQAYEQQKLRRNPLVGIILPKRQRREMMALTVEQAQLFSEAAENDALLLFLLLTGCRPGEALALRWQDVNTERKTITIQRSLRWLRNGEWKFENPKTQAGTRVVELADGLVKMLISHRRAQAEQRLLVGAVWQQRDLVFPDEIGNPQKPARVRHRFKAALRKAGIDERVRLYDSRHTAASLLLAAGTHPKTVAARLGHSSVAITMDVYSHVLPGVQAEASAQIESAVFRRK